MSARKRKTKAEWLIVGPDPHMATCTRCGKHEPKPELPTSMKAAVAYMNYLVEKHLNCELAVLTPEDPGGDEG